MSELELENKVLWDLLYDLWPSSNKPLDLVVKEKIENLEEEE